jgi:hypothetical protein
MLCRPRSDICANACAGAGGACESTDGRGAFPASSYCAYPCAAAWAGTPLARTSRPDLRLRTDCWRPLGAALLPEDVRL